MSSTAENNTWSFIKQTQVHMSASEWKRRKNPAHTPFISRSSMAVFCSRQILPYRNKSMVEVILVLHIPDVLVGLREKVIRFLPFFAMTFFSIYAFFPKKVAGCFGLTLR